MNRLYINKDWSTLKKLIAIKAAGGGAPMVEYTATGNPATFKTNLIAPMKLLIPFTPVQDLHGYDSPWPAGGGKNVLDQSLFAIGIIGTNGGKTSANGSISDNTVPGQVTLTITSGWTGIIQEEYIPVTEGQAYTASCDSASGVAYTITAFYDSSKAFISGSRTLTAGNSNTATAPTGAAYIRVSFQWSAVGTYTITGIQLEKGSSATSYAPYSNICPISGLTGANVTVSPTSSPDDPDKEVYSITFPQSAGTVYGGTLTVNKDGSGELVVDKANIASYNGETLPSTWISDRDVYAHGTTPTTGAQVVYELSTPVTYQLTDIEVIETLKGVNNVWSDTNGVNTIKYMKM